MNSSSLSRASLADSNTAIRMGQVAAVRRLLYHPYQRWAERGWLLLLRARRKRFLARQPEGRIARFSRRSGWTAYLSDWRAYLRPTHRCLSIFSDSCDFTTLLASTTTSEFESWGENTSDEEVHLLEAGRRIGSSFAWAVMTAVDIKEDGVFRIIVGYL